MHRSLPLSVLALMAACLVALPLLGQGVRITIPKRTEATPVQKLNREGVKEIQKHHLERAQRLFYKAYLIDPDDPFTLNNLGYISELEGKIERAQRYYELAAKENNSETVIAEASSRKFQGRKLSEVTNSYGNLELRINRANILAMGLLEQGRNQEAEDVLRDALKLDPKNPFTLNNLGFAMEGQGDLESALRYYNDASITHSTEPIVVALDPHWRGKAISDVAFSNEQAVRARLASEQNAPDRAARLRGDQETANEFYDLAQRGEQAGLSVTAASHHEMVGEAVGRVAGTNAQGTEVNLQAEAEIKRRRHTPIVLRRRDNSPVTPSPQSAAPEQPKPPVPRPPVDNAPVENTVPRPH